ncbi:hypothetical protein [Sphingomonas sp. Leaf242]|uniref:hypothetical protein n=1 Tax=Sphingomonas sp. Leaf242 TaxID=1736304 RepID=UPI000AA32B16|nr:hypothetical protein [Sphingomonas sp. Leaf242]
MPLVMLDAFPDGQVVFNTDDIITIKVGYGSPEIVLRGIDEPIHLPHSSVADVAAAIDHPDNRVLKSNTGQTL